MDDVTISVNTLVACRDLLLNNGSKRVTNMKNSIKEFHLSRNA